MLNQLMCIMTDGPDLAEFDFDAAAAVFVGSRTRLGISVPRWETGVARRDARETLFDWSKSAAEAAALRQRPLAQSTSTGEDVSSRMFGSGIRTKTQELKTSSSAASSSSFASSSSACLLSSAAAASPQSSSFSSSSSSSASSSSASSSSGSSSDARAGNKRTTGTGQFPTTNRGRQVKSRFDNPNSDSYRF